MQDGRHHHRVHRRVGICNFMCMGGAGGPPHHAVQNKTETASLLSAWALDTCHAHMPLILSKKPPHMSPGAARATPARGRGRFTCRVCVAQLWRAVAGCRLSAPGRSTPRSARHNSTLTAQTLARPSECRTGAGEESHARHPARDNFVRSRTMCQTETCHRLWRTEGGPREVLAARIAPRNNSP